MSQRRPFSPITNQPFQVSNYYFQIILLRMTRKTQPKVGSSTYYFSVFKTLDNQKYQSSKPITIDSSVKEASLQNGKINFVALSYNPDKSLEYALRLLEDTSSSIKEIGQYLIDAHHFIEIFNQTQNGAFTLKVNLNDDWDADIELYVEKSRYSVERLVKSIKNPMPNHSKNKGQTLTISHQKVEIKKPEPLDLQTTQPQRQNHHKFNKFTPKKQQENDKNQQYFAQKKETVENSKKKEEPFKQQPAPIRKPQIEEKIEIKKAPKGQFVPKKQWLIPEAEKYLSKPKVVSRDTASKKMAQSNGKLTSSSESKIVNEKVKNVKPTVESNLLQKLPLKPKYIALIIISFISLYIASIFFIKSEPILPTPTPFTEKQPRKKAKVQKIQKGPSKKSIANGKK